MYPLVQHRSIAASEPHTGMLMGCGCTSVAILGPPMQVCGVWFVHPRAMHSQMCGLWLPVPCHTGATHANVCIVATYPRLHQSHVLEGHMQVCECVGCGCLSPAVLVTLAKVIECAMYPLPCHTHTHTHTHTCGLWLHTHCVLGSAPHKSACVVATICTTVVGVTENSMAGNLQRLRHKLSNLNS